MAKFDPFLSLDCVRVEGVGAQSKERKGSNFAIWQPWPQIPEALATRTVFEMSAGDKLKIMTCLMQQILSYATVRDVIDERYQEMTESRMELRKHQGPNSIEVPVQFWLEKQLGVGSIVMLIQVVTKVNR